MRSTDHFRLESDQPPSSSGLAISPFCWQVMRAAVRRPFEGRRAASSARRNRFQILPLVALAGAPSAPCSPWKAAAALVRFGPSPCLPALSYYSIIHETGPFGIGLVVSGRVGAASALNWVP